VAVYGESPIHLPTLRAYSETMSLANTDQPRRHRLSVDDYRRMAEVGILAPDDRVELIDGEIIDMAPPGDLHIVTVMLLDRALRVAEKDAFVLVQSPIRLSQLSQPQPDVALLRLRPDSYRGHRLEAADVLLVVEVADSSLRFDRDTKMRLYATHGIAEAWLVDVRGQRLIRHRAPQEGAYTLVDEPDLGTALDMAALPGIAVDLRELFG
jgi:Uma2 family endonuclease